MKIESREELLRSAEATLGGQRSSSKLGLTNEEHYNVSYGPPPSHVTNPAMSSSHDAYEDIQRLRSAIARNRSSYASSVHSEYNEPAWQGVKPKTGQNRAVISMPYVATAETPVAPARAKRKARYDEPVQVHCDPGQDTEI